MDIRRALLKAGITGGALLVMLSGMNGLTNYAQERSKKAIEEAEKIESRKDEVDGQEKILTTEAEEKIEKERIEEEKKKAIEEKENERQAIVTQEALERKLKTPECRFWWEQHERDPSPRNRTKKLQSCTL